MRDYISGRAEECGGGFAGNASHNARTKAKRQKGRALSALFAAVFGFCMFALCELAGRQSRPHGGDRPRQGDRVNAGIAATIQRGNDGRRGASQLTMKTRKPVSAKRHSRL